MKDLKLGSRILITVLGILILCTCMISLKPIKSLAELSSKDESIIELLATYDLDETVKASDYTDKLYEVMSNEYVSTLTDIDDGKEVTVEIYNTIYDGDKTVYDLGEHIRETHSVMLYNYVKNHSSMTEEEQGEAISAMRYNIELVWFLSVLQNSLGIVNVLCIAISMVLLACLLLAILNVLANNKRDLLEEELEHTKVKVRG